MCWIGPHPVVTVDNRLLHCKITSTSLSPSDYSDGDILQEAVYEARYQLYANLHNLRKQ